MTLALTPLLLGLALDAYVISYIATADKAISVILALLVGGQLAALWYVFPRVVGRRGRR